MMKWRVDNPDETGTGTVLGSIAVACGSVTVVTTIAVVKVYEYRFYQECIRESTQLHTVSMASTFRLNDITFCCTSTRC